jgi:O-antigen/teichoic acid export membrane protein
MRAITMQTAAGLAWTAVALATGFALKLALARTMAPNTMGVVLAAQSLVVLALGLAALGLPDAVVRFVGRDADRWAAPRRTVLEAIKVVAPAASIVAVLAIAGFWIWLRPGMQPDAVWATVILVATLPLLGLGDVMGAALRGVNRLPAKLLLTDVARPGLITMALLLSPAALAQRAPYVAGLYAAAALLSALLLWNLFARDRRWTDVGGSTKGELLRFGIPIAGSGLVAGPVVNSALPLILASSTGPAAVALFTIALSLQAVAYLPVSVLEQAALPWWSRLGSHGAGRELHRSYRYFTHLSFTIVTCLALVLIANDRTILAFLFGPPYVAASGALRVVLVTAMFCALAGPNEGMLRAFGLAGAILRARVVSAIACVAVGLMLIPSRGLAGAAVTFAVNAVLLNVMFCVTLYRTHGLHPFSTPHATVATMATVGVVAVAAGDAVSPIGAWIVAHGIAILVLLTNAELRASVRTLVAEAPPPRAIL